MTCSNGYRVSAEDDARFEREYASSNRAVDAVAEHLRQCGNDVQNVAARDFVPRAEYVDNGGDLVIWRNGKQRKVEVKGRTLHFTSEADFPFPTIIVDRSTKTVDLCALYVIVNSALTVGAFIPLSSKPHWIEQNMPDRKRGYDVNMCFLCPKDRVQFVKLERRAVDED